MTTKKTKNRVKDIVIIGFFGSAGCTIISSLGIYTFGEGVNIIYLAGGFISLALTAFFYVLFDRIDKGEK